MSHLDHVRSLLTENWLPMCSNKIKGSKQLPAGVQKQMSERASEY